MNNNIKITIFPSVKADTYKTHETNWQTLCKVITGPKLAEKKEDMPLLKMASFTGEKTLAGSYRHDDFVEEVYGIEGDYDGGQITIEQAAEKAKRMGISLAFYSTARSTQESPRWRVIAPLLNSIQPEERQYWVGMLNYVMDGILAPESFALSQSFYYGKIINSDYQSLIVEGQPIDTFDGQFDPIYIKSNEKPLGQSKAEGGHEMSLEEASRMLEHISPNCDYHDWVHVGMALKHQFGDDGFVAWDQWSAQAKVTQADGKPFYQPKVMRTKWSSFGVSNKENPITIATAIKLAQGNGYKVSVKLERISPIEDFNIQVKSPEVEPKEYLFTISNGKIEPTQANLLKLIEPYQFRYDNFTASYMGVFDDKARILDEADYTRIQLHAEQVGFKRITTQMVRENVLMVCLDNTFDSAIEWAKTLIWDGMPRCKNLLHTYFGAEDSSYIRAASMYITSAMGGRLLEPGCKADSAIVLYGPQGGGKSISIQSLAPRLETFAEINLNVRDNDLSRLLRGKLIGELAELRGLKSKESEDIKAWVTRTTEEWTPKYMEFTKTFKRRLTFWGSTNDQQFLNDVTGNRRWLPVAVNQLQPNLIKKDCEQIWAEAIEIYKANGVLWQEVEKLAEEVRQEFFDEEPIVEEIRNYFIKNPQITKITGKEIWSITEQGFNNFDRLASKTIARAMEILKWKRVTIARGDERLKGYAKIK